MGNEVYWSHEDSGYVRNTPKKHSTKLEHFFFSALVLAWKAIGDRKWIGEISKMYKSCPCS
jgi:hypothetical protein